ncbi:hypothetical protein [Candidatus Hodarchaeum mangrovi]|nr:hypothetical protein [Asgard group archaeon]
MVVINRNSDIVRFIVNFVIAEILFFIGTAFLGVSKMLFNINMIEVLEGSFLGDATQGLWTAAFSTNQITWLFNNLFLWWVNVLLAIFNSLLLGLGLIALMILVPLGIPIFEGPNAPQNAIAIESMPVGFLFLFFWVIFPFLFILRTTWYDWIKHRFKSNT